MYNSAGEDSMSMIASGFPRGNLSIARSNSTIYPNALAAAASSSTWNQNTKGDSDSRHLISSASCQHPQLQPHLSDYHPKDAAPARPRRIANSPSMSMVLCIYDDDNSPKSSVIYIHEIMMMMMMTCFSG